MSIENSNKQTASTTAEASTTAQTKPTSTTAVSTTAEPSTAAQAKPTSTTAASTTASTSPALPDGYLANGSMLDADGVMHPEYLDGYPQELAQKFKPLSAASFQRAFLSKAKEANKKKTLYSVKKNTAQGMVVTALKLVNRTKDPAPAVLLDMIRAATASVEDDSTFTALYMHLDAICTYMMME